MSLTGGQGIERGLLEILGDQVVEPLLLWCWDKLLNQRMAVGELHVLQHLLTQRAFTEWPEPLLELLEVGIVSETCEPGSEALQVPEGKVVNDAHQAVKFEKGIL